ncbi:hypothetical protein RYX36_007033 [Vicia faba]
MSSFLFHLSEPFFIRHRSTTQEAAESHLSLHFFTCFHCLILLSLFPQFSSPNFNFISSSLLTSENLKRLKIKSTASRAQLILRTLGN